jgi:hypothetical protein
MYMQGEIATRITPRSMRFVSQAFLAYMCNFLERNGMHSNERDHSPLCRARQLDVSLISWQGKKKSNDTITNKDKYVQYGAAIS